MHRAEQVRETPTAFSSTGEELNNLRSLVADRSSIREDKVDKQHNEIMAGPELDTDTYGTQLRNVRGPHRWILCFCA